MSEDQDSSDKKESSADNYDSIIEESLGELDKRGIVDSSEFAELADEARAKARRLHPLVLGLVILAALSCTLWAYQGVEETKSSLDLAAANKVVFGDIQRTPQSKRAKQAAFALSEFVFAVGDIREKKSELAAKTNRFLAKLHEKLESTEEDQELLKRFARVVLLPHGAVAVVGQVEVDQHAAQDKL